MIRARHRWHWLCRCTGLGQPALAARNRPAAESRAPVRVLLSLVSWLLALLLGIETPERLGKIHYPRVRQLTPTRLDLPALRWTQETTSARPLTAPDNVRRFCKQVITSAPRPKASD
jgi:hypothetical protein